MTGSVCLRGIIFTGGPRSVYEPGAPGYDPAILELGIPILGICYGHQLLAYLSGGKISSAGQAGEYGKTVLKASGSLLLQDLPAESICWMSHRDTVVKMPPGFRIIASTDQCPCAAMADEKRRLYGV